MRKPDIVRRLTWRNPLSDFVPRPYLDSPVFPKERTTPQGKAAINTLLKFYTPERSQGEEDARKIRNFIRNPEKQVFVIWGDIGIGKSWFVRYQLESIISSSRGSVNYHYGVIDMLRAAPHDAVHQLENQLINVLEAYFRDALGGLRKGLIPYAEFKAANCYADLKSDEFRAESQRIIQEVLESRETSRIDFLLNAMEFASGPPLFVAIDNIDRSIGEDQNIIADLVARRLRHPNIYTIFSLRSSSRVLLDEAKILGFFEKSEMHLSAVNFPAMLRRRFAFGKNLENLSSVKFPIFSRDADEPTTFPELLELFLKSHAGQFVLDLASTNSRKLLDFVSRLITSNQLGSIKNLAEPESCIAALLMLDQPRFDPELSYILNLFDNNEQSLPGNALIRYRVLEYLEQAGDFSFQERRFTDYFNCLGYAPERVREVIATFVGAGLAQTTPPRDADNIRQQPLKGLGTIGLIRRNAAQYSDKLLKSPWYFICVKGDVYVPDDIIRTDKEGQEYVTDNDFVEFLKAEELQEKQRVSKWSQRNGHLTPSIRQAQPWALAKAALEKRRLHTMRGREGSPT